MSYTRICVKLSDRFNEEERYQTNNLELVYCFLALTEDSVVEQYYFDGKRFQSLFIGSIPKQYYQAISKYLTAKRRLKTGT